MEDITVNSPGQALDWLATRALLAYKRRHASGVPVTDLFANHVRTVESIVTYYPSGVLHVNCSVHSKTWTPVHHEFARFEKSGVDDYIFIGGTVDL
jgi:hypothetical protein